MMSYFMFIDFLMAVLMIYINFTQNVQLCPDNAIGRASL